MDRQRQKFAKCCLRIPLYQCPRVKSLQKLRIGIRKVFKGGESFPLLLTGLLGSLSASKVASLGYVVAGYHWRSSVVAAIPTIIALTYTLINRETHTGFYSERRSSAGSSCSINSFRMVRLDDVNHRSNSSRSTGLNCNMPRISRRCLSEPPS